jgi:hypothetical protein
MIREKENGDTLDRCFSCGTIVAVGAGSEEDKGERS